MSETIQKEKLFGNGKWELAYNLHENETSEKKLVKIYIRINSYKRNLSYINNWINDIITNLEKIGITSDNKKFYNPMNKYKVLISEIDPEIEYADTRWDKSYNYGGNRRFIQFFITVTVIEGFDKLGTILEENGGIIGEFKSI
jgi:hypothetical protein